MKRPTEDEIRDAVARAYDLQDSVGSQWPGASYEQGVTAALNWVLGEDDAHPLEED